MIALMIMSAFKILLWLYVLNCVLLNLVSYWILLLLNSIKFYLVIFINELGFIILHHTISMTRRHHILSEILGISEDLHLLLLTLKIKLE